MKTTIRICILGIACSTGLAFSQNAGGAERLAEFIKKIDANGDGKITKEEFLEHFKKEAEERFAKVDANGDGVIDDAEAKAAAEKLRDGAGRRRGEGGAEGQGGGFRRPPEGQGARPEGDRPSGPRPEGVRPEGRPEGGRPEGARPEGGRPEGGPRGEGRGPGGPFGSPEERFKKMDKNNDGSVDAAEYREFATQEVDGQFKRIDENGDGKVSLDEMKKAGERLREFMRRGPGAGGEGGMRRPPGGEGAPGPGGPEGTGGFRRPPGDEPAAPKKDGV